MVPKVQFFDTPMVSKVCYSLWEIC